MTSSIGIAPNIFLGKVGSDLYKPNGLTIIRPEDLPRAFDGITLRDLPGIGRRMHVKLQAAGIHTVRQLYGASELELSAVWGGVVGRRWWHMIRGSTDADYACQTEPAPKMVSNSHVMDPLSRSTAGAEAVLLRLLGKAAGRLRIKNRFARRLHISVSFQGDGMRSYKWTAESGSLDAASDLLTWLPVFRKLWSDRPRLPADYVPKKVGVAFSDLLAPGDLSASLFQEDARIGRLAQTLDEINQQFKEVHPNKNTVDLASLYWLNTLAPERIAFRKITDDDRERAPTI